jgi:hypothetical protein
VEGDFQPAKVAGLAELRALTTQLRAENARLLRLLDLTPKQAALPGPAQTGEAHVGLYPLLDGDLCWWLAADFDGPMAMLDALAYLKAARAWSVPAALEVSRSGVARTRGCSSPHPWPPKLLAGSAPPCSHRRTCYQRAAWGTSSPLHGKARHDGATVFLDLASAETLRKNLRISAARSRMLFRLSEPSGLAIETRTWWRPVSLRRNDQVSCHRACEGSSPIRRSRQPTR